MRRMLASVAAYGASLICASLAFGDGGLGPIETVSVGKNREFRVNGKPFFPIMLWLQSQERIADGLDSGINTFCGNGGSLGSKDYLDRLAQNGLYGIVHFRDDHREVLGHSHLLGWIHGDEPDLTRTVSEAVVEARPGMHLNTSTPLYRIVDGDPSSWTVLDPLDGAEITVKPKEPLTAESLAVSVTVSSGLAVAKQVALLADGKEVLKATLENKRGPQKFQLDKAVTFNELTLKVLSSYPGKNQWGSLGEIEAFDKLGRNVLLSPTRQVARTSPQKLAADYGRIKAIDTTRPVLLTFTGFFFEKATRYDEQTRRRLYPEFIRSSDVVGFDIYPIFGSGYPSRLNWVADATQELVRLAGPRRPVYAWIETNKGSKWITYSKQLEVEPKHTRCETWMAIIRGATAIGYFTHRWRPDYKQFAPGEEMVLELKRLNDQITRLAAAILAPRTKLKVAMTLNAGLPCHFKATDYEGRLYIFAQNIDLGPDAEKKRQLEQVVPRSGKATVTVEGLKAGRKIEVIDENRTITAGEGRFSDDFPPLGEHIYRLNL